VYRCVGGQRSHSSTLTPEIDVETRAEAKASFLANLHDPSAPLRKNPGLDALWHKDHLRNWGSSDPEYLFDFREIFRTGDNEFELKCVTAI